jgi:hypothetical protein
MAPDQIGRLSDYQICSLSVGYRYEPNTEAEIARRGLVCTAETVQCMSQGIGQGNPAMGFCVAAAQAVNAADARAAEESARRDYAVREYGDNGNAKHLFIWQ